MSEIQRTENTLEQQKRELRRTSSLRDLITRKTSRTVLLADVSGSMNYRCQNGKSRMENLHAAISPLPSFPTIGFGFDQPEPVRLLQDKTLLPEFGIGGTPLAEAFALAKMHGFGHVVVITDGQPNSQDAALREAQGLKVDCIYVADPPMPEFLKKLCNLTGGSYENIRVDMTLELTSAIRGLLEGSK